MALGGRAWTWLIYLPCTVRTGGWTEPTVRGRRQLPPALAALPPPQHEGCCPAWQVLNRSPPLPLCRRRLFYSPSSAW